MGAEVRVLSEMQRRVFLDRYALKGRDPEVGQQALVLEKGHPRRGEVGRIEEVFPHGLRLRFPDGEAASFGTGGAVPLLETSLEETWRRVARAIAQVEGTEEKRREWEERFLWALQDFKFVPAGRILAGAGTGKDVTFYNCYVLPSPADSRKGIMRVLEQMIEIMARGGGVGINGSTLRPQGAYVRGVNGTSSGAVSWLEIYSDATGLIEQGGTRRGALMLMLAAWHPDIEHFVTVKRDLRRFTNANLSVVVPDAFMEAVFRDGDWDLVFPYTDDPDYDRLWDGDLEAWKARGKPVRVYRTLKARRLWDLIIESNWLSGEPGVVFLDRYNRLSNTWYFQKVISVNPCGEQGLPAYGVCNLGSLGLPAFLRQGKLDWELLGETIRVAVRFLDDVIDATSYIYEENRASQMEARRVGLGTQGLAHLLLRLGLRYGSPECLGFLEELYRFIMIQAYEASVELAREKGPFGAFDAEKFLQGEFIRRLPEELRAAIRRYGIRNATLLTQAPTGTTSLLAGMSSGIEPVFRFRMKRRDRMGEHLLLDPVYEEWASTHPGEQLPPWFVEAQDLTPEDHVRVQAVIQKYVDQSISKTVNAPREHTREDTRRVYELAYQLGCKGITYFREGSREGVLEAATAERPQVEQLSLLPPAGETRPASERALAWGKIKPISRPSRLQGFTDARETPLGKLFLTLNTLDGHPVELFAQIGKAGSDVAAFTEAVARLVSLALRSGIDPAEVADQLAGIGGSRSVGFGPGRVRSVPDAIGQFLLEYLHRGAAAGSSKADLASGDGIRGELGLCPQCGLLSLAPLEGCATCLSCGFSEC